IEPATDVELGREPQVPRVEGGHEVVGYRVRDGLMERAFITVAPDIELQRFQLHAEPVRNVLEMQRREVGLPRFRAQTRELGYPDPDRVIAFGLGIRKRLERLLRRSR